MRILGMQVGRRKSADDLPHFDGEHGGWWPIIREGFAGAWQQNVTLRRDTLLAFTTVYACVNRIASDIAKMQPCLKKKTADGIWVDIGRSSPLAAVLEKPNDYQTRIQFAQSWLVSKLLSGNTYTLKVRDQRGVVVKLYTLDPTRCRPMITPTGDVYYELGRDPLSEIAVPTEIVPASEIIHDRMPGMFHPLIGTSPIFACGLAAAQGHHIMKNSASFFKNSSQPSGVLTAPGTISQATADRLKQEFRDKYSGHKAGSVAILGDGLKFEKISMSAADSQVIEQLKWSSETVCSAFNVPPFMVGVGPAPAAQNLESLLQLYYSQCLQIHIEDIELLMDEGLGLLEANTQDWLGVCLDTDSLLRMDTASRYTTWSNGIKAGFMAPNEARKKEDMAPVKGGDTPYMQQQNFSLEALARRDNDAISAPASSTMPTATTEGNEPTDDETGKPVPTADDLTDADSEEVKQMGFFMNVYKMALEFLERRIKALEEQQPKKGEKGDKGDTGEPGPQGLQGPVGERGLPGNDGVDGKDGTNGKDGVNGIDGKDGADGIAGRDGADGKNGTDGKEGPPGPPGRDGKDGSVGLNGADGIPGAPGKDGLPGPQGERGERGERGESGPAGVAGKDGRDGLDGLDGKDGAQGLQGVPGEVGPSGKDGLNGKDGRDGLDGKDGAPGVDGKPGLNGKDGRDGVDGKSITAEDIQLLLEAKFATWELQADRRIMEMAEKAIAKMPQPKNGADGVSATDIAFDGQRTVVWTTGEKSVTLKLPIPIYREIWKDSVGGYEAHDTVTFGGSLWIALQDTKSKPGTDGTWKLAVKHGRDGRDKT